MKRRGFTLIELMIVVAIIGILSAIAIPKFVELKWRATNKGREAKGLAPLPMPKMLADMRQADQKCGDSPVVSAVMRDGVLIKVHANGCDERSY